MFANQFICMTLSYIYIQNWWCMYDTCYCLFLLGGYMTPHLQKQNFFYKTTCNVYDKCVLQVKKITFTLLPHSYLRRTIFVPYSQQNRYKSVLCPSYLRVQETDNRRRKDGLITNLHRIRYELVSSLSERRVLRKPKNPYICVQNQEKA